MHRISIVQALSLWSELESARCGKNGFGGNTAEIYMYRLMPRCPGGEAALHESGGQGNTILDEMARELIQDANESLCSLLAHYAKTREAVIEIEGRELGDWLKTANFGHRVHVKVAPR